MSITRKILLKDGTEYPSITAFCQEYDLGYQITVGRLNNDWSPEECIDPTLKTDFGKHKTDYTKNSRYSPKATEERRVRNHARWIKRASKKHGDHFCYNNTLSDFKNAKEGKVKIKCLHHSLDFHEIPDKHITLRNGGCESCWKEQVTRDNIKRETPKFLEWFNENLSERLELRSEFQGWNQPLDLFCKIHNTVHKTTIPSRLKYGGASGCDACSLIVLTQKIRLDLNTARKRISEMRDLPQNITLVDVVFDESAEASRIGYSCSLDRHGFRPRVDLNHFKRSRLICDLCTSKHGGRVQSRYLDLIESGEEGLPAVIGVIQVEVEGTVGLKVGVTTRTLKDRYRSDLQVIFFELRGKERLIYFLENRVTRNFADFKDTTVQARGLRGELKNGKRWGGDTEIFQQGKKQEIIDYIVRLLNEIKSDTIGEREFKEEVGHFISIDFEARDVSREKDMSNQPIAVVGIDAQTNEIKYQLDSISDALALGFNNISTLINEKNERRFSKGIRWFKKSDFDPDNIPPMGEKMIYRKPVRCIETGEVFRTTVLAEKAMRSPEHLVSASKITSVCRGHREKAGGYSWEYVN